MRKDESLYLAERVRESLASDPSVAELGIEVVVFEERVVLKGTLTSDRRKAQILAHVRKLCPDLVVGDELRIEVLREPKTESV
jgi:osmotically-inducible protein OsmY